jgi:hypothetical protein
MKKHIQLIVLVFSLSTNGFSQVLTSDSFNNATINSNWFFISPNPAGYHHLTGGGELLIYAAGTNGGSDLYSGTNFNAPRLLQAIDTANHNFQIDTRLRFNPTLHWQSAGIVFQLSKDSTLGDACARIVNRYDYTGTQAVGGEGTCGILDADTVVYLRVQRSSDSTRTWVSKNGTSWQALCTFPDVKVYYVGLVAERQPWGNSETIGSYAYFDYFNVSVITGTEEQEADHSVSIYPNPAGKQFNITSSKIIDEIRITNSLGQLVEQLKPNERNVSVQLKNEGLYFITIVTGKQSITRKMLVKDQ